MLVRGQRIRRKLHRLSRRIDGVGVLTEPRIYHAKRVERTGVIRIGGDDLLVHLGGFVQIACAG